MATQDKPTTVPAAAPYWTSQDERDFQTLVRRKTAFEDFSLNRLRKVVDECLAPHDDDHLEELVKRLRDNAEAVRDALEAFVSAK